MTHHQSMGDLKEKHLIRWSPPSCPTTSVLNNEYDCKLEEAGYTSMLAMGFYYVCLILVCCLPKTTLPSQEENTKVKGVADDTRSTGGISRASSHRSRSRSVHFWDEE